MWTTEKEMIFSNTYLSTIHEFHHKEEILIVFVYIVEFDDIWMINLLENIDFILKSCPIIFCQFAPLKTFTNMVKVVGIVDMKTVVSYTRR